MSQIAIPCTRHELCTYEPTSASVNSTADQWPMTVPVSGYLGFFFCWKSSNKIFETSGSFFCWKSSNIYFWKSSNIFQNYSLKKYFVFFWKSSNRIFETSGSFFLKIFKYFLKNLQIFFQNSYLKTYFVFFWKSSNKIFETSGRFFLKIFNFFLKIFKYIP